MKNTSSQLRTKMDDTTKFYLTQLWRQLVAHPNLSEFREEIREHLSTFEPKERIPLLEDILEAEEW